MTSSELKLESSAAASSNIAAKAVFGGLVIAAFAPSLIELARFWATHAADFVGLLAPAISIAYLYIHRDTILAAPVGTSNWGGVLVGIGLALQGIALAQNWLVVSGFALVISLVGASLLFQGPARTRRLWFPLTFLLFAFPVLESLEIYLSFPMRLGSSVIAEGLVSGLTEVSRDGTQLTTPNLQLSVVAACSGLNYMATLLMFALGIAATLPMRARARFVLITIAPAIVLFANGVRIAVVAMIGELYGRDAAVGFFHDFSGLVTFFVAVVGLIGLGALVTRWWPAVKEVS
ncbi:MAG: exosortase/archaeosortase family protein [Pseudomonadota bacterium]